MTTNSIPIDATATPAGQPGGFETVEEWVAFESHTCDRCGATNPDVRLDEVWVGGRGLVSFYRCSRPDAVVGWVFAECGAAK